MRDLILVFGSLAYLPVIFRSAAAGVLCWEWFSIMNPHRQVYGFANGQPFNSVIAVVTIMIWLCSAERKRWTPDVMPWLLLLFTGWMTFNSLFAMVPEWSWQYWDRTVRTFAVVFLAFFVITGKARVHGLVWAVVIALGYYGIKGGVFVIRSGGSGLVYGPEGSILADNNQLALAVVSVLPLAYYLFRHTRSALLKAALLATFLLEVLMVLGTQSRGGVIALATILLVFWVSSDRKAITAVLAIGAVLIGLRFMPESFFQRMDTLNDVNSDSSFQGRVDAWHVATLVAMDRFPFGAGFYAPQLPQIFNHYLPDASPHAAHSIYFQVLGEHGFIGLAIFIAILVLALRNAGLVIRQTRGVEGLAWAHDLAKMVRTSLIGYYVGGAALSMAYFDGYLIMIAILSCLREIVAQAEKRVPAPTSWRSRAPTAASWITNRKRTPAGQ
ncbi:MAG: putative O-glycosylation ligase, exosortase A system-associated [Acetobacteraceae bacterium]|nr:putative O-glycosylation ligase, exosortase A system-associated [Acetobacteraceae bacterium]